MKARYVMGLASMVASITTAYYPSCDSLLRDQLLVYCTDQAIRDSLLGLETTQRVKTPIIQGSCPLLDAHPKLTESISYLSLGSFPTPILRLETISSLVGHTVLLKHDGLSGATVDGTKMYGGNKIRKLEFLFADALSLGVSDVFTFGGAGSNHALATSIYAQRLGLKATCFLLPQYNSRNVRSNLLAHAAQGSTLRYYPSRALRNNAVITHALDSLALTGTLPYIIPTGGSSPVGILGFVNAVYELAQQIKDGMPCPDVIYVALGSYGTYAGLLLGVELLQLPCTVIGIAIEPITNAHVVEESILSLIESTRALILQSDQTISLEPFDRNRITIIYSAGGQDYGLFTDECIQAVRLVAEQEQITLDGTYTGKAFAGVLEDLKKRTTRPLTVLYWHTFSAHDNHIQSSAIDYTNLPIALRDYFIHKVQPLDQY